MNEHCEKCNIPLGMSYPPSYTCWNTCFCHTPDSKDIKCKGEFYSDRTFCQICGKTRIEHIPAPDSSRGEEKVLTKEEIRKILGDKAHIDYERNHSHYHCWDQVNNEDSDIEPQDTPACGQKLEDHKQCCLCDTVYKPRPKIATSEKGFIHLDIKTKSIGNGTVKITPTPYESEDWEAELFGGNSLPCCKVCQCDNGKKIWCACHRKQIKDVISKVYQRGREEERKFILNILDGIDQADKEMGNKGGGTKAIRFALQSRIINNLPKI